MWLPLVVDTKSISVLKFAKVGSITQCLEIVAALFSGPD